MVGTRVTARSNEISSLARYCTQKLLTTWSKDNGLKSWIEEGRCMSHNIVNELIILMGRSVLRLLCRIKNADQCWFTITVDKTADVVSHEQLL